MGVLFILDIFIIWFGFRGKYVINLYNYISKFLKINF